MSFARRRDTLPAAAGPALRRLAEAQGELGRLESPEVEGPGVTIAPELWRALQQVRRRTSGSPTPEREAAFLAAVEDFLARRRVAAIGGGA